MNDDRSPDSDVALAAGAIQDHRVGQVVLDRRRAAFGAGKNRSSADLADVAANLDGIETVTMSHLACRRAE